MTIQNVRTEAKSANAQQDSENAWTSTDTGATESDSRTDRTPERNPTTVERDEASDTGGVSGYGEVMCECELDAETRSQETRERADRYLVELAEELGESPPEAVAEAQQWWSRIEQAIEEKAQAAKCGD